MTAIILAGGSAKRLGGRNKAFLPVGKEPLIKAQLRVLKKIFKKIIIVTNSPEEFCSLKGVEVVGDVIRGKGPLAGLYSGLLHSKSQYNFLTSCDAPFLNPGLIKYMFKKADGFDAVVPKSKAGYETLCAVYSKDCLGAIKKNIRVNKLKVSDFYPSIKLKVLKGNELIGFGGPERMFMNINTPEDLCRISTSRKT